MDDMLAEQFTGLKSGKKPTRRGRRSGGKGPMKNETTEPATDPHAQAKAHLANAQAAADPMATKLHLFKALSSLKKC